MEKRVLSLELIPHNAKSENELSIASCSPHKSSIREQVESWVFWIPKPLEVRQADSTGGML